MPLNVLLMGTGDFALPAFRAVLQSPHHVPLVVTQPDKTGRGHHHHVNVVKQLAEEFSVPVLQPPRINRPEVLDLLRHTQADVFLVASFGQILRPELLDIPPLGAFNLHGSLLPGFRGAAPVQYAIWKGETVTGVTIFRIEPALDSGPMIGHVQTPINPRETAGELMLRLANLCVPLTLHSLDQLEHNAAIPVRQNEAHVTLAPKIQRSDGAINWNLPARLIDCHIRAMQPWPKASTLLHRKNNTPVRCIIHQVHILPEAEQPSKTAPPGSILLADRKLLVRCADGWLELLNIQPEGRRNMDAAAFINGHPLDTGAEFHPENAP